MAEPNIKLGGKIRELRRSLGISQEELAFKAKISTTYLGQLERNEKSPTVETLNKISKALDIGLGDFFDSENSAHSMQNDRMLNKIVAQLSAFSEVELSELLKIIKSVKRLSQ